MSFLKNYIKNSEKINPTIQPEAVEVPAEDGSKIRVLSTAKTIICAPENHYLISCVAPDTWIKTLRGSIQAKDIQIDDEVYSAKGYGLVKGIKLTKNQPVYTLTTRRTRVTTTSTHRFYSVTPEGKLDYIALGDLKPGDWVVSHMTGSTQDSWLDRRWVTYPKPIPLTLIKSALAKVKDVLGIEQVLTDAESKGFVWLSPDSPDMRLIDIDQVLSYSFRQDIGFEQIKTIEPAGISDVYDFSIPTIGEFTANGFVTHNCDFIAQELYIAAVLSNDPGMLNAFNPTIPDKLIAPDGTEHPNPQKDMHTLTAATCIAPEAFIDQPEYKWRAIADSTPSPTGKGTARDSAKVLSYGIIYAVRLVA